jgi:molybdate transport repressor ModE-like protein
MIRINIDTIWRFRKEGSSRQMPMMTALLNEIRSSGKLTEAARRTDISYRHAWDLLNKWSAFFGAPLVERHPGKGTTLTQLGEKLVWANEYLAARLGPQFENLAQQLETDINSMIAHGPAVVRVHASHGFAVSKLREILARNSEIEIDLRYVTNQNSLVSLVNNTCDLAGVHIPRGSLRKRNVVACKERLDPRVHRVVGFVTREMGLIVKRGNPYGISSLERLVNPAIRFINRDHDSGTRQLFDQLLAQRKVDSRKINGYQQIEFTHAAVAAYVASDFADVGFGVEAAARQFGLDFVRIVTEDYLFVGREQILHTPPLKRITDVMRGAEFQTAVAALPGYVAVDTGIVKTLDQAFDPAS